MYESDVWWFSILEARLEYNTEQSFPHFVGFCDRRFF